MATGVIIKGRASNGGEAEEYESVTALIEALRVAMPNEVQIIIKGKGEGVNQHISRAFYDSEEDRIKLAKLLQTQVDLCANPRDGGELK